MIVGICLARGEKAFSPLPIIGAQFMLKDTLLGVKLGSFKSYRLWVEEVREDRN